jgi:hypothetical protein
MARPIRIADLLALHRDYIIAVDENGTLYQHKLTCRLATPGDKIAAFRRVLCSYETTPWQTCSIAMSRADLEESVMLTKAMLRDYRDRRPELVTEFQA